MKINTLNKNLVLVFSETVGVNLPTDPIDSIVQEAFRGTPISTIVTKLPDQVVMFIPQAQFTLGFAGKTFIVGDQSVSDNHLQNIQSLIKLAVNISEHLNKTVDAYGYNFIFEVQGEGPTENSFASVYSKIQAIFPPPTSGLPSESIVNYFLPTLSFLHENVKFLINFEAVADNPRNEEANRIRIRVNVHFNDSFRRAIDDLNEDYRSKTDFIYQYLRGIFN